MPLPFNNCHFVVSTYMLQITIKYYEIIFLYVVYNITGSNVEFVQTVLTYFDYGKDVKSQNVFNISCLASVVDTDYEYFGQDDFRVRKPDIVFQVSVISLRAWRLSCFSSKTIQSNFNGLYQHLHRKNILIIRNMHSTRKWSSNIFYFRP